MKKHRYLAYAFAALALMAAQPNQASALPVQFDSLGYAGDGIVISNGYAGLNWNNFRALDADYELATYGPNGYTNGNKSGDNVAFNFLGAPASILSPSGFDVTRLWATAAWRDGLDLSIKAFRNGVLVFDTNYILSTGDASLITLALTNINELRFASSGGTVAGLNGSGTHFALDDINVVVNGNGGGVTPVPLPSPLLMLLASLFGLRVLHKKKTHSARLPVL
jgi:hypothetical protein